VPSQVLGSGWAGLGGYHRKVASKIRFDAAEQRIRALAYAGLGSVELRVSVLAELARVCPAEGAFFPTADPATLLYTSAVRTGMPGGLTGRFLHNEFSTPDVNKFRSLVAASITVATLDQATRGNWRASARFREIIGPAGLGDELRTVFQTGTTTFGYACLHRAPGASFDDSEIAFMQVVAPHIGEALRRSLMAERALRDASPQAPGMLTLAPDLTLLAATPAGEYWLEDLAAAEHPRSRPLPVALLAVAQALRQVPHRSHVPRLTVQGASGHWLVLHASHMTPPGGDQIGMVIEPASRAELEPVIAVGYRLTPRETQIMTLLLRGLPTKTIAATLRVTINTANDHIKAIFTKTGVSSRGELMARVFRDHSVPRP
jgi:DNA-binding CsgD family transcriptional regulator